MNSLRLKIGFGFFIIVGISIATGLVVLINVQSLRSEMERMAGVQYKNLIAAENIVKSVQRQESAQFSMLVQDVDVGRMMVNENRDQFLYWYDRALKGSTEAAEVSALDSLFSVYRKYLGLCDSLQSMIVGRSPHSLLRDFQFIVIRPVSDRLKELSFHVLDQSQNAILRANREAEQSASQSAFIIIAAAFINLALSIIAAITTTRSVVRPLSRLTRSVRMIGSGRLDQKIDVVSEDEIGVLSAEFNKMTERLRSFEELNIQNIISEKTRSEGILESISDPILVTDAAGSVLMMNHAARVLARLGPGDEWRHKPASVMLPDEEWLPPVAVHGQGQDTQDEILMLERDGLAVYYRPLRRVVIDEKGTLTGVVTLYQDVTRFKQIEQMKSDFLAAVSHEFRTPLTSISMTIDILSKQLVGPLNDRQSDLLDGAKKDSERLKKLVEELLTLSKLESVRDRGEVEPVRIARVIEESVLPLRLPIAEKRLRLKIDIEPDLPTVSGDFQQLCWALVNLVSNAVRYSPHDSELCLSARCEGGNIRVDVTDRGRGIAAEDLETIFGKFVQIKHPDDATPGSVGLGLTIAKQVLRNHGGRLWATSKLGEGSTFSFTLPLEPEQA